MIPRTKIVLVECRLNDVSLIIMGKPIIKVRMFPSKMESEGYYLFVYVMIWSMMQKTFQIILQERFLNTHQNLNRLENNARPLA